MGSGFPPRTRAAIVVAVGRSGLLADGYERKTIANQLGISNATVSTHVAHIYEKLEVRTCRSRESISVWDVASAKRWAVEERSGPVPISEKSAYDPF